MKFESWARIASLFITYVSLSVNALADEKLLEGKFIFHDEDLSHPKTRPFRSVGKFMSKESRRWNRYRREIDKYPNAVPCLISGINENSQVDLRDFDWSRNANVEGLNVCVFRILDTLPDVALIEEWIASQGFSVIPYKRFVNDRSYVPVGAINPTHLIEGTIPYGTGQHAASKALSLNAEPAEVRSFSLAVMLDRNGNVADVSVTARTQ